MPKISPPSLMVITRVSGGTSAWIISVCSISRHCFGSRLNTAYGRQCCVVVAAVQATTSYYLLELSHG
jgi:hypothetical protein